jgi:hypothetical protein
MNDPKKPSNEELYQKTLKENPPEYAIGDLVKTSGGIGYISGRVFKDKEKIWKYTIRVYGLKNYNIDVDAVLGHHNLPF